MHSWYKSCEEYELKANKKLKGMLVLSGTDSKLFVRNGALVIDHGISRLRQDTTPTKLYKGTHQVRKRGHRQDIFHRALFSSADIGILLSSG